MYHLDEKFICGKYKEGLSISNIASLLGISSKPISRILKKNKVRVSKCKYILNEGYFNKLGSSNQYYILGMLYADGNACNSNGSYTIKLTLKNEDLHILKSINTILGSNRPLYIKEKYSSLQITNRAFFESLIRLGVVTGKTFKIRFPDFVPNNFIWDFLRGFYDGDGYFYFNRKKKKGIWAICCNRDFGRGVFNNLEALGFHPTFCENITHKNTVEIRIHRSDEIISIYDKLYDNDESIFLFRKQKKMKDFVDFIKKIKSAKAKNKSKIVELYQRNFSGRHIAKITKISRYTVDKVIKEFRVNSDDFI